MLAPALAGAAGIPKLQWTLRSDDLVTGQQIFYSMAMEKSGNIVVAGWGEGKGGKYWLVQRYSPKGARLWSDTTQIDAPESAAYAVAANPNGGFVAVGEVKPAKGGRYWLIQKYMAKGSLAWSRSHANQYGTDSWIQSVIFDSRGDVVAGGGEDLTGGGRVWRLRKFNGKTGGDVWSRMFAGPVQSDDGADIAGLAAGRDGAFFAVGFQHEVGGGSSWVVRKLTSQGREAWLDVYAGVTQYADARADRAIVEPDGSVITAGHELAAPWPDYDWVVRKTGPDGKLTWMRRFTGVGGKEDIPRTLARVPGGALLMAGYQTEAVGERSWMVLRIDKEGRAKWKMSGVYSPYRCSYVNGAAITSDGGHFYLAGGPATGWLLRKYAATGGVEPGAGKFPNALFDTKSDFVNDVAKKILAASAEALKADPDIMFRVEGHADERGTEALNYELGLQRAEQVAAFLESAGIPRGRMIIQSFGETAPVSRGDGPDAWRKNRRVHLALLPLLRDEVGKK